MRIYGACFERMEPPDAWEGKEVQCPCCGVCADTYYRDEAGEIVGCESCLETVYWYELLEEQEEFG